MRKAWGKGKNEVLALKSDILDLFGQGMTGTEIYQHFIDLGCLKISYRTFAHHVKALRKASSILPSPSLSSPPPADKKPPAPKPASNPASLPRLPDQNQTSGVGRTFNFDQNQDVAKFWQPSDKFKKT